MFAPRGPLHQELGREPINLEVLADVRFKAHYGPKPDVAPSPRSAKSGHAGENGLRAPV